MLMMKEVTCPILHWHRTGRGEAQTHAARHACLDVPHSLIAAGDLGFASKAGHRHGLQDELSKV